MQAQYDLPPNSSWAFSKSKIKCYQTFKESLKPQGKLQVLFKFQGNLLRVANSQNSN